MWFLNFSFYSCEASSFEESVPVLQWLSFESAMTRLRAKSVCSSPLTSLELSALPWLKRSASLTTNPPPVDDAEKQRWIDKGKRNDNKEHVRSHDTADVTKLICCNRTLNLRSQVRLQNTHLPHKKAPEQHVTHLLNGSFYCSILTCGSNSGSFSRRWAG